MTDEIQPLVRLVMPEGADSLPDHCVGVLVFLGKKELENFKECRFTITTDAPFMAVKLDIEPKDVPQVCTPRETDLGQGNAKAPNRRREGAEGCPS